ncbi:MAG: flagellar filament capping protein FliD [Nitrospirota bacterium]
MGITSSAGLVSGIKFDDLIANLLQIERRPIALLEEKKADFQAKSAELSNLSIQLSSLRGKASALSALANFNNNKVSATKSSTGVELLTAQVDRTAVPGQYQVKVNQLAQTHSLASQGFVDQSTTAVASSDGTLTFKVGAAGKTTSVSVTTSTTLVQLRDLINAADGDATASIISDGSGSNPYRLVLTAKNAGAANTITISSNPTTLDFTNKQVEAAYAATTNSFTGTVSSNSGNNYTGTTNKTFLVKIVTAGAAGAATYKYSTDGGINWLGANGAAYTGSNAITTQGSLTNYVDGAASSNSTNEGVQIAFGSGTLAADDTFTVDVFNPTLQSAQDAVIQVGNLTFSKTSNTIADAIQGVTLSLLKADSSETITVGVTADSSDIKARVKEFVSAYNEALKYLNDQLSYDPKNPKPKPLLADSTALSLQRRMQTLITSAVPGASTDINSLSKVGITSNKNTGQLTLDETKFDAAVAKSLRDVTRLFIGLGVPSHSTIEYVSKTGSTQPGTYSIEVTTVPTKATITAGSAVPDAGITSAETITVSLYSNATSATDTPIATSVSFAAGSKISDIVNGLNSAFATDGIAASASNSSGTLKITATNYGDDYKLVAFSNVAAANQSGIGTTTLTSTGVDVAGRINSHPATGVGEVLTSDSGFGESGLKIKAPVTAVGSYGTVTVSSGIADRMADLLESAVKSTGTIQTRVNGLGESIAQIDKDITRKATELIRKEAALREQFARLETLLGQYQTQSQSLTSALAGLQNLATIISKK